MIRKIRNKSDTTKQFNANVIPAKAGIQKEIDPRFRGGDNEFSPKDSAFKRRRGLGWVALVGAGPGDPGLLTLRGEALLKHCDLVVSDALVDPYIFSYAPQAKKIVLGKRGGGIKTDQQKIERLLISSAKKGLGVVRLKGGDPFVFGRGAEEAWALKKAKIPFEVVPGVSAGHAVPAYAGIPLTHRNFASQVTFVTGHEALGKGSQLVNWKELARLSGTIVTFMGLRQLPFILRALKKGGLRANMPISVIEWGTTPKQRVVSGIFSNIEQRVKRARLTAPALAVIGEVNKLRPFLKWFEKKALFGQQVIITRAKEQMAALAGRFRSLGADVVELPTIDVKAVPHSRDVREILAGLSEFDFLIFTSANGVSHFWDHMSQAGLDARALSGLSIIAVGPGTSAALRNCGIRADLIPDTFTTADLLKMLVTKRLVSGKRFLLARSDIASRDLVLGLIDHGASVVKDLVIYRTEPKRFKAEKVNKLFLNGQKPLITFTSASTVTNFVEAVGRRRIPFIARKSRVVSIGPVTTATAKAAGLKVAKQARVSTIDGLVEAAVEISSPKTVFGKSGKLDTISISEE